MSADPFDDIPDAFDDIPDVDAPAEAAAPESVTPPAIPDPPAQAPVNISNFQSEPDSGPGVLDSLLEGGRNVGGFLAETGQDGLRGGNQGLTWLGADELVGGANALASGGSAQAAIDKERAMDALAESRSPAAFQLTRAAGFVPGMLAAAPAAIGAAGRLGLAGIQGMVSGALGSNSNSLSETADDTIIGGGTNALLSGLLDSGGELLRRGGQFLSKGKAPPAPTYTPPPRPAVEPAPPPEAPQLALPGMAPPEQLGLPGMPPSAPPAPPSMPSAPPAAPPPPMQQPRYTAPGLRQHAELAAKDPQVATDAMRTALQGVGAATGLGAMGHGVGLAESVATGLGGMGLAQPLGTLAQGAAPPMLRGAANAVAGVGNTMNAIGQGAQALGTMAPAATASVQGTLGNKPRIDDFAAPAPAAATAGGRGNLLPQAALEALYGDAQALGDYQADFAQAAVNRDPGAVGALISRLTQSDPKFRQQVLPTLQKRTANM